jgi:hypothetical protein
MEHKAFYIQKPSLAVILRPSWVITGPGKVDSQVLITFTRHRFSIWCGLGRPEVYDVIKTYYDERGITVGSTMQSDLVVYLRPG